MFILRIRCSKYFFIEAFTNDSYRHFVLIASPKTDCPVVKVDLLKDQVEEVEEQSSLILKELRAKTHDFQLLTRDHAESTRSVQLLQSALEEQQSMLVERGLVLLGGGEGEEDEEVGEDEQERRTRAIVSQETANILSGLGNLYLTWLI